MAKFNLGKITDKAKDFVDKNSDKIVSGVDKVTDKVDQKTKGKYRDKLQKVDSLTAKLDKKGAAATDDDTTPGTNAAGDAYVGNTEGVDEVEAAAEAVAATTPEPTPSATPIAPMIGGDAVPGPNDPGAFPEPN